MIQEVDPINSNLQKAPQDQEGTPLEAQILIDRHEEWHQLWSSHSVSSGAITYVWGAPGIGKTFLVRHLADRLQAQNRRVLWSSGREVGLSESDFCEHVARVVESSSNDSRLETLSHILLRYSQTTPFCWIVDDFDQICVDRNRLVHMALELGRQGNSVVLVGRSSPYQLWTGQAYIRSQLHLIELTDWSPDVSREFLMTRGITEKHVMQRVLDIARGRPQLLSTLADGLSMLQDTDAPTAQWAFMAHSVDMAGYFIEQLCHPGSRRLMWRAGQPTDAIDTLVAAASLVPMFNREWMSRVVGRPLVHELWDTFVNLPILDTYRGGYYGLFPKLRGEVARVVQKVRPWIWEHWTRQATRYYLARIKAGSIPKQNAWELLSPFIRPRIGRTVFDCDDPLLEVHWAPEAVGRTIRLVNSRREVIASAAILPDKVGTLSVGEITLADHHPQTVRQLVSALAKTFYQYQDISWQIPDKAGELRALMEWLQFKPGTGNVWTLDFRTRSLESWLESLVAPPQGKTPENPIAVVQLVLQALREGSEQFCPEVDQYWASLADGCTFRSWFLDALNSADLGERVDGKTVLVLYYLDRRGTHEELAELLHVSRATYFRNHRNALERLAHAVFN